MQYTVKLGDCMSSIAFENGFFWKTLWNLPENAALKTLRKNPNVLMTGDVVYIPDLRQKQVTRPTGALHQFVRKGVPEIFRMRLVGVHNKPRAHLDYVIVIDGVARRGKTDANGRIQESIPPNAKAGKLTVAGLPEGRRKPKPLVIRLLLGHLDPVSEISGVKARLANLGFYHGAIDGNLDAGTARAISAFQKKNGLPENGLADDATKALLQKAHGH